jgi:hypothetical protein
MESTGQQFGDDDVLLRRVPPSSESFQTLDQRADGGFRAVSAVMSVSKDEEDLSCSLRRITSPRELLDNLRNDGIDPVGWHVCWFLVSDVKELGLSIAHTPTDRDPGHCSITSQDGLAYPKNKAKKLARRTRILADHELDDPAGP